ncbi:glycine betaine ABC transporter substrate-binding protein, partial [Corynebacterium sp.]|uniref:glycine betaine ABC transporter substrate-binding protein n=1 Tax=Corynebacterium sp. TaxID=1720 RepID=UPI002A916D2C
MNLTPLASASLTALAALTLTACGSSDPFAEQSSAPTTPAESGTVVIGTANFPESEIIGQIWAEALRREGYNVEVSSGIGSREVYLGALEEGSVNLVPEYAGNLAQYYGELPAGADEDAVTAALADALPDGLETGEFSPAESKDAYRVTRELADQYGLVTIADLDKLDTINDRGAPRIRGAPRRAEGSHRHLRHRCRQDHRQPDLRRRRAAHRPSSGAGRGQCGQHLHH